MFLEVNHLLFKLGHKLIMSFIYLPPDRSPFYANTDATGIKLLENHLLKPEIMNLDAKLIILGDLNAGVADRDDFVNDNYVVPSLQNYEDYLLDDINIKRNSCDKQVNKFGMDLLHFCKTYMIHIRNGRYGADKDAGHFTFTGTNGNSVIDYIICSNSCSYLIESFSIEERTESSHFPVSVSLKCLLSTGVPGANNVKINSKQIYIFNDNNIMQYRENLALLFTKEFIHSFSMEIEDNSNSIDSVTEKFTNILKDCGQSCNRNMKTRVKRQPYWFDETGKELKAKKKKKKKKKYNLLHRYRHERTDSSLLAYIQSRNNF